MTRAAYDKGYDNVWGIFFICLFCSPFGYFYVIALPDKNVQKQNETIIRLLREGTSNSRQQSFNDELPPL